MKKTKLKNMKTLLEQARAIEKSTQKRKAVTDQEIDLFLAILNEEITPLQAKCVLYPDKSNQVGGGSVYARGLIVLREAYRKGMIKIIKK